MNIGAVVIAVISAAAAIFAAWEARRSKAAEIRATEVLDLERRLSEARQKVFEPMIEALGRFLELTSAGGEPDADTVKRVLLDDMFRFAHWVQIYGSDDAVLATMHFMQALWVEAPVRVTIRLQGELILATRRELGHPETAIRPIDNFALRINDAFTDAEWRADLTDPLDAVFARHDWTPPWIERTPALIAGGEVPEEAQ